MKFSVLLSLFFSFAPLFGQDNFYFEDYVYVENIKSVKLFAGNNPLAFPISNLSGTPLFFEFDDIEGDSKDYYYKIIHCDRNWNPSDLDENDYLFGFNGEEIVNKKNSSFTLLQYTHYSLRLPNKNLGWKISGNYLLVVYDDEDEVVITKRFVVVENLIKIFTELNHSSDVSKYRTTHNIKITLNSKDYNIVDPLKEISVSVLQNGKWFDAVQNIKPKFVLGNQIRFDAFSPFEFYAVNEFRYFDTRNLHATNIEIKSIDINRTGIDVILEKDEIRKYSNYFFHKDINGNFLVFGNEGSYSSTTGQYTDVNFLLETFAPLTTGDVYVIGDFCNWQIYDENKLEYDEEYEGYTGTIMLKQGVYDYYYAVVNKEGKIDLVSLEGSLFETQNDYMVLVYDKPFGGLYDKIIGVRVIE